MLTYVIKKFFGTVNERKLKRLQPLLEQVNKLEGEMIKLSDIDLRQNTEKFKHALKNGATLDSLLPEAFATVREASKRVLGIRHFDVQILGGIVMHHGMIAEMKTGEGKTVVATLPAYLNALMGEGVHIVTVNDYLADRDATAMGKIYNFLGLTVGCIKHGITDEERKQAYESDITYGTNNEFGFDFLRDNLKLSYESIVQRPLSYAIVDEVDSILIDEARTPLIISGPTEENVKSYSIIDRLVKNLSAEDYEVEEKSRNVFLTEVGHEKIESLLRQEQLISEGGLYDLQNIMLLQNVSQALKAHHIFQRDVDYIVKDHKVVIIDEFTGRIMEGRRYSDGLHQALEAKENVTVQNENQTLASITFQNYFRMYKKLAGMTGTAMTEANEFSDIYKLQVMSIPTNLPITRIDEDDVIYSTSKEKYKAIVAEISEAYKCRQPVLVGTVSIEKSEMLSKMLRAAKIPHNVLNARYHEQEAQIIAQAGRPGAVTIATNMAGRGTDIQLGGNPNMLFHATSVTANDNDKLKEQCLKEKEEVLAAGGLLVLGTERHEAKRIDDQLCGRSGRQGDIGRTKFYLSLEDDLMRRFGSEKLSGLLSKLGLKEDEAIFHPWISNALRKAQQKIEGRNYEARKNLLQYDNVMNEQRNVIYQQRIDIMTSQDVSNIVHDMINNVNLRLVELYLPANKQPEEWDIEGLMQNCGVIYNIEIKPTTKLHTPKEAVHFLNLQILDAWEHRKERYGSKILQYMAQRVLLITLDHLWKDHLHSLDCLRSGIHLRAYAQKDPLNEYKFEAFRMFEAMLEEMSNVTVNRLFHIEIEVDTSTMSGVASV